MTETPGSFKDSYSQGIMKVLKSKGKYAFIGESPVLERIEATKCELQTLPGAINYQGYAFAFPKSELSSLSFL